MTTNQLAGRDGGGAMLDDHKVVSLELASEGKLYRATYFLEGYALHIAARGVKPVCITVINDPCGVVATLLDRWIHDGTAVPEPERVAC